MSIQAVLLPVFVQVALTFVLLFRAWRIRGAYRTSDDLLDHSSWQGELELPVLFYVLTIFAWDTKFADLLFLVLAWVFVVLRVVHAFAGMIDNAPRRELIFMASAFVLA